MERLACHASAVRVRGVEKENIPGPEHPDVAMTLNNLAAFYKSVEKYAEAEPF
jgi:hypothetical protein